MSEGNTSREVTVWMWACDTHGTQPVHYQARGSWVRSCRECGRRLYQTLKWVPAAGIQRIETKPVRPGGQWSQAMRGQALIQAPLSTETGTIPQKGQE